MFIQIHSTVSRQCICTNDSVTEPAVQVYSSKSLIRVVQRVARAMRHSTAGKRTLMVCVNPDEGSGWETVGRRVGDGREEGGSVVVKKETH